jgi:hypothetical protein
VGDLAIETAHSIQARYYRRLRLAGLCTRCRRPSATATCADCRPHVAAYYAERRAARVAAGLCAICGREPVSRFKCCVGCRMAAKARRGGGTCHVADSLAIA